LFCIPKLFLLFQIYSGKLLIRVFLSIKYWHSVFIFRNLFWTSLHISLLIPWFGFFFTGKVCKFYILATSSSSLWSIFSVSEIVTWSSARSIVCNTILFYFNIIFLKSLSFVFHYV
jgi:hypothetical protein